MTSAEVALVIARWQPASLGTEVADFAKKVVTTAAPTSAVRAKALLFAAGKLGTFATSRRRGVGSRAGARRLRSSSASS